MPGSGITEQPKCNTSVSLSLPPDHFSCHSVLPCARDPRYAIVAEKTNGHTRHGGLLLNSTKLLAVLGCGCECDRVVLGNLVGKSGKRSFRRCWLKRAGVQTAQRHGDETVFRTAHQK